MEHPDKSNDSLRVWVIWDASTLSIRPRAGAGCAGGSCGARPVSGGGMFDVAERNGDEGLLEAAKRLVLQRGAEAHVRTGGMGSTSHARRSRWTMTCRITRCMRKPARPSR